MKRIIGIVVLAVFATGCAGLEIGTRAGIYRVDERQESQRTYKKPLPWKCYFTSCEDEDVRAS